MGTIAFEIAVNGEYQYTVGAEGWQHISAQVSGWRFDPDQLRMIAGEETPDLPTEPFDHLQLRASVSVSGEDFEITARQGRVHTKSRSGSYQARKLSPGDVVQIRVVDTGTPDAPEWADPNLSAHIAMRAKPDPE